MKKGKFIVVDGGEGAGKTTLLRGFAGKNKNGNYILTKEVGGTPYADKIKDLFLIDEAKDSTPETQFALVFGARHDHITKKIEPALSSGINVISDRFDSSTYAIQVIGENAPQLKELFFKTREVFLRDCMPDLYVFLDVEPKTALARVETRGGDKSRFDRESLKFHNDVNRGYKEFFETVPHKIIDANQSAKQVLAEFEKIYFDLADR